MEKKMFEVKRTVRLSETDATGVMYFTNLMKFAVEAFEEYMESSPELFKEYLMPIVSAKGNYVAPLFQGDEIVLKMNIVRIGNSSVEIHTDVEKEGVLAGKVEIVHVTVSKESGKKVNALKFDGLLMSFVGELSGG